MRECRPEAARLQRRGLVSVMQLVLSSFSSSSSGIQTFVLCALGSLAAWDNL